MAAWLTARTEAAERESDRGAVIVGAAILDDLLRRILLRRLVPAIAPKPEDDEILERGPASEFGPRINLAYRMGLIERRFRDSLHLVRDLRNVVSHASDEWTVDSPNMRRELEKMFAANRTQFTAFGGLLRRILMRHETEGEFFKGLDDAELAPPKLYGGNLRKTLEFLLAWMALGLALRLQQIEPIPRTAAEDATREWLATLTRPRAAPK